MHLAASEGLVEKIYEAALLPELWPRVLDEIAALSGSTGSVLFTSDHKQVTAWTASAEVIPLVERFIAGGWVDRNPRDTPAAQRLGFARFGVDLDLYTPEELEREPMYASLLRPLGFGWFAGTLIRVPTGDTAVFDVERRYDDGPMPRDEVLRLDGLRPHLARAAVLSARLGLERARAQVEVLAQLGLPAAVIASGGRVLASNALMESTSPQVLIRAFDRVSFASPAAQSLLSGALTQIEAGRLAAIASFPLPGAEDLPAAVAHVVPVHRKARDVFTRATALLIVTPLAGGEAPSAELLAGLFDLSPAEARVARALSRGGTADGVAAELGVSPATIRTQVKAVLAKTGVRRKTELVRLLGRVTPIR